MCCADVCSDVRVCANQCVHNAAYLSECERAFVLAVLDGWRVSTCWPRSEGVGFNEESRVQRNGAEGFTKGHVNGTTHARMHTFICFSCIFLQGSSRNRSRSLRRETNKDEERS